MGNTIRRQPVNFNIPKSPDYKFLNITDFRGLHITDNPFTGDSNTASDLLNVYVDEQNTLTTRPRLQKKFDLKESAIIPEDATIISINYVDNKYLVQYKYEDEVCIFWLIPLADGYKYQRIEITKSENCSPIGESKIQIVKHKDYYVLVDGVSYKVINENNVVCNASEKAYAPLITINKEFGVAGSGVEYESKNILTGAYRESYGALEEDFMNVDFTAFTGKEITLYGDSGESFSFSKKDDATTIKVQPLVAFENSKNITGAAISDDCSVVCFAENANLLVSTDSGITYKCVVIAPFQEYDMMISDVLISGDGNTIIAFGDVGENYLAYAISKDRGHSFSFEMGSDTETRGPLSGRGAISYDGKTIIIASAPLSQTAVIKTSRDGGTTWTTTIKTVAGLPQGATAHAVCSVSGGEGVVIFGDYSGNTYSIVYFDDDGVSDWRDVPDTDGIGGYSAIYGIGLDSENTRLYLFVTSSTGKSSVYWVHIPDFDKSKFSWKSGGNIGGTETRTTRRHFYTQSGWFSFDDAKTDSFSFNRFILDGGFSFKAHTNSTLKHYGQSIGVSSFSVDAAGQHIFGSLGSLLYNNYAYPKGHDFVEITVSDKNNEHEDVLTQLNESLFFRNFNNFLWLGGNKNFIIHSAVTDKDKDNDVLYMPVKNKAYLGNDDNEITGFSVSSDNTMIAYTKDNVWLITRQEVLDNVLDYVYTETRSDNGHVAKGQTIITPLNELPLQLNKKGFFVYQPIQNVLTSDKTSVLISEGINAKLLCTPNLQNAYFVNHLYWSLMLVPEEHTTHVFVFDDRNSSWYYWTFGEKLVSAVNIDDEIELTSATGRHFTLETTDIINEFNSDVTEYYDDGKKIIPWFWKTQVLPLGTMNYSKKLVDTTFIVADTEMNDEYGLNYAFTAYRKMLSETTPTTISSKLNYVQSTTKRTLIPRFNFLQMKISNVEDDLDNNKLRLIGLGLKYVLLEGLLR